MSAGASDVRSAAQALREGRAVVLPTDTVYGVAVDPRNPDAVRRLFALKGRPETNPLPLLVRSIEDAKDCVSDWPGVADRLARAFWPGALTIVLPKAAWIDDLVTAGAATVGVRRPDHPIAQSLLNAFGGPIACTSANLSGEPAATELSALPAVFFAPDVSRLDGGKLRHGSPSTVVAVADKNSIQTLREGAIPPERLQTALDNADNGSG